MGLGQHLVIKHMNISAVNHRDIHTKWETGRQPRTSSEIRVYIPKRCKKAFEFRVVDKGSSFRWWEIVHGKNLENCLWELNLPCSAMYASIFLLD